MRDGGDETLGHQGRVAGTIDAPAEHGVTGLAGGDPVGRTVLALEQAVRAQSKAGGKV